MFSTSLKKILITCIFIVGSIELFIVGSIELDNSLSASFSFGEIINSRFVEITFSNPQFLSEISETVKQVHPGVLLLLQNYKRLLLSFPSRTVAADSYRILKTVFTNHCSVITVRQIAISEHCLLPCDWCNTSSSSFDLSIKKLTASTLTGQLDRSVRFSPTFNIKYIIFLPKILVYFHLYH